MRNEAKLSIDRIADIGKAKSMPEPQALKVASKPSLRQTSLWGNSWARRLTPATAVNDRTHVNSYDLRVRIHNMRDNPAQAAKKCHVSTSSRTFSGSPPLLRKNVP